MLAYCMSNAEVVLLDLYHRDQTACLSEKESIQDKARALSCMLSAIATSNQPCPGME